MPEKTLGLSLKGDLSLAASASALSSFSDLLSAIAQEEDPHSSVDWTPEKLSVGSMEVEARGSAESTALLDRIDRRFLDVGESIRSPNGQGFSVPVTRAAQGLIEVTRASGASMRFSSPSGSVTVGDMRLWPAEEAEQPDDRYTYSEGSVEGIVETATIHNGLGFTLYDSLNERAIRCHYHEGNQEQVRRVWGKRAVISGTIQRDAMSGRPTAIRNIKSADPIEDVPTDSYLQARGAIPLPSGGVLPEVAIRLVRNAE